MHPGLSVGAHRGALLIIGTLLGFVDRGDTAPPSAARPCARWQCDFAGSCGRCLEELIAHQLQPLAQHIQDDALDNGTFRNRGVRA
eukprot:1613187-Prymnesium_polylepis.1